MKKYSDIDIQKARALRKNKRYSFAHLQRLTGIPATTIRNWCANDFLGTRWDTLLLTNERKRKELKYSEVSVLESLKSIDGLYAKIYAAILYACEGSKYPKSNKVDFVNSEPNLAKLFITLLRKAFILDESKFRIHLQIHDTHDFDGLKEYWSRLLNIPTNQFIKPTITKPHGGKHRKEYNGTCSIRYMDFRIQLKLMGVFEAFATKFGEVA